MKETAKKQRTFITVAIKVGGLYAGPDIRALSWLEASKQAAKHNALVMGELA